MSIADQAELLGNIIVIATIAASMAGAQAIDAIIRNRDRIRRAWRTARRILRDGRATPRTIRSHDAR